MDQFKQISTFVEVAARGSLSAAARAEGVAPAMVGRRLDALESRLGVKLLQRTTRRLMLTDEGNAFLEDCQRVLAELHDAESAVMAGSVRVQGHVFVSAPAGFGREHVAPLVAPFCERHKDVRVTLDLTDRIVDVVAESVDVAIRIGETPDSSLVGVRLGENQRVVVGSQTYLAAHGIPAEPEDLLEHNCLTLGPNSAQHRGWTFRVAGQPRTVKVSGSMACSDGSVLRRWALEGHGLAWRSLWEVGEDIRCGRLVSLLDEFRSSDSHIMAVFAQRRHLPHRVRVWVEFLKEHYASAGTGLR